MYFLTVLMLIASLLCLGMIVNLMQLKKHDRVLFRLCAVRRDIMVLLRDRGFNLPKDEYRALRLILTTVNNGIHNYNDHKVKMFDFRSFSKALKAFKRGATAAEKFYMPRDNEVIEIYKNFGMAMMSGFFAYTPFIRSEIGMRVLVFFFAFLAKSGKRSTQQVFENLVWAQDHFDRYSHQHA